MLVSLLVGWWFDINLKFAVKLKQRLLSVTIDGYSLCCTFGYGSYTLTNSDTSTTLASRDSFTTSQKTNFCLSAPSAGFVQQSLVTNSNIASEISIYPNRFKGTNLNSATSYFNIIYEMINSIGQIVAKAKVKNNLIDLDKLEAVAYQIRLTT